MKKCQYCDHEMLRQNYKKHVSTCPIRKNFGLTKTEILSCISQVKNNFPHQEDQMESENKDLKTKLTFNELLCEKAYKFLRDISIESSALVMEKEGVNLEDPMQRIEEMILSEGTREEYKMEWKLYSKYCDQNKLNPLSDQSSNKYLQNLKVSLSTILKKRGNLQSILSHLVGRKVKLLRIGKKVKPKLKYALSIEEIDAYLKEQIEIDEQDYLIQRLLLEYGCRVNTAGLLKLRHLEFLDEGNENIILPDSKTGPRVEKITPDLRDLLTDYVEQVPLEEDDYIFTAQGDCKTERKRCHAICVRINKRIKESKALRKSKNYQYSSHMFRKTKAFSAFQDAVKEAKNRARRAIGQANDSTAIESYINMKI